MNPSNTNTNTRPKTTDARFLELLNLHIDGELPPGEAAEFDAALRANPARRRTLEQYRRIQTACAQLFDPAAPPPLWSAVAEGATATGDTAFGKSSEVLKPEVLNSGLSDMSQRPEQVLRFSELSQSGVAGLRPLPPHSKDPAVTPGNAEIPLGGRREAPPNPPSGSERQRHSANLALPDNAAPNSALRTPQSEILARALADAEHKIQRARARAAERATRLIQPSAFRLSGIFSAFPHPLLAWVRGRFAIGCLAVAGAAACVAIILHTRAPDAANAETAAAGRGDFSPLFADRLAGVPQHLDSGLGTRDAELGTRDSGQGGGVTSPAVQSGDKSPHSKAIDVAPPANHATYATATPALIISSIQGITKRFRFPTVTTFSDNAPQTLDSGDSVIAWTKGIQLRPIRKVSADDAFEALIDLAAPKISATALPHPATSATAHDYKEEMAAFQFHK